MFLSSITCAPIFKVNFPGTEVCRSKSLLNALSLSSASKTLTGLESPSNFDSFIVSASLVCEHNLVAKIPSFSIFCLAVAANLAAMRSGTLPMRILLSNSMNSASVCRWTFCSSNVRCTQRSQAGVWKQNFAVGCEEEEEDFKSFFVTGGSWKKSPHSISWMPPNGLSFRRILRATVSIFLKEISNYNWKEWKHHNQR